MCRINIETIREKLVILINDGSTDNSGKIMDKYAEIDKRVKVFHKENEGVSSARNSGIERANGKFLTFIDSDDWIEEEYLESLIKNMKEDALSVCSDLHSDKNIKVNNHMTQEMAQTSLYSSYGMGGEVWGKMFDVDVIKKNDIKMDLDIAICEDLIFVMKYIFYMKGEVVWKPLSLYHYQVNNSGALIGRYSQVNFDEKTLTEFEAVKRSEKWILNNEKTCCAYEERLTKGACNTLRTMVANKHIVDKKYVECLKLVRKNIWLCLKSKNLAKGSKLSIMLCAIYPKLEWKIWEFIHQN